MSSSKRIVVLGGGVGGLVAANELARLLPRSHHILLVERGVSHAFAPSFLWLMTGGRQAAEIMRPLRALVRPGVEIVGAEACAIDLVSGRVETDGGSIAYDTLVVALGAELAPDAIPGLETAHTFYTLEGAEKLRDALAGFTGGTVAVVVSALPYKCPGAPHEGAMLLRDFYRRRGLSRKVELHLFTPEPQPMPVAGPELGAAVREMLETRDIAFHPSHKLAAVHPDARDLEFEGKPSVRYDLLVAIPPHRGPRLARDAGLSNETGWVPVDRRTLATRQERVYAIGDVTAVPIPGRWKPEIPLMLPKAGVFAHGQALVVARRIAAEIAGTPVQEEFGGEGYCALEAGEGAAGFAFGDFFGEPSPEIQLRRVGKAWHAGKVLFESWWLSPFGLSRSGLSLALKLGGKAYGVPVVL
jgi:sulfide:quinone oxidoreductase